MEDLDSSEQDSPEPGDVSVVYFYFFLKRGQRKIYKQLLYLHFMHIFSKLGISVIQPIYLLHRIFVYCSHINKLKIQIE